MKNLVTWKLIADSLATGMRVILLYVVNSLGSSPGRIGFCMAVTESGTTEGSLGGGIMEHKFVEMAKVRLLTSDLNASVHQQVHNKTATTNQSGMICSGEQTILIYPVPVNDRAAVITIIELLQNNGRGKLTIEPGGISIVALTQFVSATFDLKQPHTWRYIETLGYVNRLFVVGGGHCSLALSEIMRRLDFYIEVFEERTNLKTLEDNESAHQKHQVENYALLTGLIPEGEHTFVVIMTVGYRTDGIALRALLGKNFRYLGVLGSTAKIAKMLADLRLDGYTENTIGRIYAPVGIPIHSRTPEEVAISIAAEIICVKNS